MNLLIGFVCVFVCMIVQCAFVAALRVGVNRWAGLSEIDYTWFRTTVLLSVFTMFLFIGMLVQVVIWASVFIWIGEMEDIWRASYFSMVNFTSLGYGDIVLSEDRSILGPLEAANGILMLGLSTSALITLFRSLSRAEERD